MLLWNAEGLGNSPSNPKVADIVSIIDKQNIKLVCLVETWWDGARDSVVPVGWQGAVGSTYWTSQGNVRRGIAVSVFVQLSSNGRTGIFSMVISWKFAQGPGAQFAFFLLGHHFRLRLTLRTFFFLHGSLLEPGRDPVDD